MRTKLRVGRPKLTVTTPPRPSSTSTSPRFLLNLNEAYEEGNVDENVTETMCESDTAQDNNVGTHAIDEANVCKESIDGLDCSQDSMDIDWLEGQTCIRCGKGGGQVLICRESGCPVVLHEKCMGCEPKFDDLGKFFCPYCWYKRELVRTRELRKKAMLAKKVLSKFMDSKFVGGNTEKQEDVKALRKKPDGCPNGGDRNNVYCENGMRGDEARNQFATMEEHLQSARDNMELADTGKVRATVEHQTNPLPPIFSGSGHLNHSEEEKTPGNELCKNSLFQQKSNKKKILKICGNALENGEVDDSQCERNVADQRQGEQPNAYHIEDEQTAFADSSLHASSKRSCGSVRISDENKDEREEEEEQVPSKAPGDTISAKDEISLKVSANVSMRSDSCDSDDETLLSRKKCIAKRNKKKARYQNVDPPNKSSSEPNNFQGINTSSGHKKKIIAPKSYTQARESPKTMKNLNIANEKRKRLHWKPEEEEMLKEGVQKFSSEVNKNLPWRKVLEFGRHMFDATRTPIDLKDKWRNMMGRESSGFNRR